VPLASGAVVVAAAEGVRGPNAGELGQLERFAALSGDQLAVGSAASPGRGVLGGSPPAEPVSVRAVGEGEPP
jgi:hypothetical protein